MFWKESGTVLAIHSCTVRNKSIPFQALIKGFFFGITDKTMRYQRDGEIIHGARDPQIAPAKR